MENPGVYGSYATEQGERKIYKLWGDGAQDHKDGKFLCNTKQKPM